MEATHGSRRSSQLGVYVQEKAEQIDRLQSSLATALTSEQAQLQAIRQSPPGAGQPTKKRTLNGAAGCATIEEAAAQIQLISGHESKKSLVRAVLIN